MRKLILLLFLFCIASGPYPEYEQAKIEAAILWVVTPPKRFDEKRARPYYGTRAYKDPEYRAELARAFKKAAKHFSLPTPLLMAIGYRESVFRTFLTGPGGELGIMQVCAYGRRKCKEYCGEIDTVEGGIMCGACWLDKNWTWCDNDLLKGLNAYVSGKCNAPYVRSQRAVKKRLRLWAKLAERLQKNEL